MAFMSVVAFFFVFINLLPATILADYLSVPYCNCLRNATNSSSLTSAFQTNLKSALDSFTSLSSSGTLINITSTGSGIDQVYAMFQCRADQSTQSCSTCVSSATSTVQSSCPSSIGARIMLEGCYLRYDNQTFLKPEFNSVTRYCGISTNDTVFLSNVQSLIENVTTLAPKYSGYAAQSIGRVSALAECLAYLNESECYQCLTKISWPSSDCVNPNGEQVYLDSCYARYENFSFFTPSTQAPTAPQPGDLSTQAPASPQPGAPSTPAPTGGLKSGWKIAIIIISTVIGSLFAIIALYRRLVRHKAKRRQGIQNHAWAQPKPKIFLLHKLKVATRDFHPDNMLGRGGFGNVYKGILPNGELVAVKKLSLQSQQGMTEFLNEVNLITNVQHKNLIKLLGCCVEGPERILVYEYLRNKSVHTVLFGNSTDDTALDWPTRYNIILGTARGLAYLHEESQVRIIHRDIKLSNILLDDQLNPKIADFGLARLVSDDESRINTRFAGTLGYVAPEYAIHGELSEKADVFSFGVVTLEIVSGRRNSDIELLTQSERLLERAWRLYREQKQLDLVDPNLGDAFIAEEMIRMVHVALLCTQESAVLRPTMSTVTSMLSQRFDILQTPTKPPFVGESDLRAAMVSTNNSSRNTSSHLPSNDLTVVEPR